ncbi:lipoyl protein ligase domain-containing protein [Nocardioides sp. BYT-33-1]|uniref:lipoyl protein ligase domain-containing protein n=1 Tax=Nocardioides sp. BYT-33-1 TaxID=3416952 RepID=UPI003F533C7A
MLLREVTGSIADFHARPVPDDLARAEVWSFLPDRPALVLGSAQDPTVADAVATAAAGVDVVRRRSGGGAVYVDPDRSLWLDVVVPRDDPRWSDDVRASVHWLGEAWQRALASLGVAAELYRGGLEQTPWGRLVCFAALGPGEVLVEGRKLVGISQRRTRVGARFQCIVYEHWDPYAVLDLLELGEADRRRAGADLADRATGVGPRLPELRAAVLGELLGT